MQIIKYPAREDWTDLLVRPAMDHTTLYGTVREVLDDVRHRGDEALRDYTRQFDQVEVGDLAVSEQEFAEAERVVSEPLKQAIEMANIYSGVLANMTDAFASIVSNNLNNVMRIFTIISISLSIPTLIFSMYGMNFDGGMMGMPFTDKPWGFLLIVVVSMALAAAVTWFLTRSRWFK